MNDTQPMAMRVIFDRESELPPMPLSGTAFGETTHHDAVTSSYHISSSHHLLGQLTSSDKKGDSCYNERTQDCFIDHDWHQPY